MLDDDPATRYQNCEQILSAFAELPVAGGWDCFVTDDLISWTRKVKQRVQRVGWRRHSERKHEWRAWSEPVGKGRNMALGVIGAQIGRNECLRQLKKFFAES